MYIMEQMEQFESDPNKRINQRGKGNTNNLASKKKSRSWFFTFNNYSKEQCGTLAQIFSEMVEQYVFQEETGENGTKHLQGAIRFKNPVYMKFQCSFPKEIHWERCRNWRKAVKYCSKRDTRTGEVYHNIKGLKIRKAIKDPLEGKELYEWEKEILKIIKGKVDDRKIYWYWNDVGCNGKSVFCKHLVLKHGAIMVGGKRSDIEYAIGVIDEDKDIDLVVIDIARGAYNKVSYVGIENLKNGLFFSGKYESKQICINTPHIIVFCNYEPIFDMLSEDRWIIRKI